MAKKDIRQEPTDVLGWDQFDGKPPQEALPVIYRQAMSFSHDCRGWYWKSIANKRLTSLVSRLITFLLAGIGVASPLVAAVASSNEDKLVLSQLAVVALAVAGVTQLADRVFGWSSGWIRYISTVTAMENLTRKFQMEWALYCVNLQRPLAQEDVRPLFEIAQRFQIQLGELQVTETDGWIAEFNTGRAMLAEVIKASKEAADKYEEEVRNAAKALSQAGAPGSIELTFTTTKEPPPSLRVSLDGGHAELCRGLSWARLRVDPGHHEVVVQIVKDNEVTTEISKIVELAAGAVARLTIPL